MALGSGTDPTMGEMGLERLRPPEDGALPLNGGLWTLPHYETFVSFMNQAARTYWWSFDEALKDSQCNSDAMWNDLTIRDPLNSRQRPVTLLEWQLEPQNPASESEKVFAEKLTKIIKQIPYLQQMKRCMLDAMFFGKSAVQILPKWDYSLGYKRMIIKKWMPIHGDKIVYKYDGTPGILVNATYKSKQVEPTERGPAYFLNLVEQDSYLIHRFEPEDATYYRPEFAGSVYGSGLRGRVYWWWWLRTNLQKFLMNFVKKAGNGYLLVAFPQGNAKARSNAQQQIEGQEGNNILYIPVNNQNGDTIDKVVQHVQVSLTGADFQWTIITGINEMIRQTILGENMTTQSASTGLGSTQGDQHGITADERVKYDATDLETPMQDLVNVLNKYNCPGNPPPTYVHLADKRNPQEIMAAAQFGLQAGMAIPTTWVQDQLGIPKQIANEPVLATVQPMQATAVGNTPSGTPMAGPSGPAPQQGQ